MDDATEQWRPVAGFEGYYEVSDHGRVRSLDRRVDSGPGRTRLARGRVLSPGIGTTGYRFVQLAMAGSVTQAYIHALVLTAFVGARPDPRADACHADGDPSNNSIANLRWDTRRENVFDAVRHGTHYQASRQTCPRGHGLEAPNLTPNIDRAGNRGCYACSLTHPWGKTRRLASTDAMWLAEADRRYAEIMHFGNPIRYSNNGKQPRWQPVIPTGQKLG